MGGFKSWLFQGELCDLGQLLNLFWTAVSSSVKWWCTFPCQTSITFKWQGPNWHWLKQKGGLLIQVMKSPYTVSSWFVVPMWSRVFPPSSLGSSFLWVGFILREVFLKSWQRWTPANPGLYQFSKSREFPRDSVVGGKKKKLFQFSKSNGWRVPPFPIFLKNVLGRLLLVQFWSCAPFWTNYYGQGHSSDWPGAGDGHTPRFRWVPSRPLNW